MRLYFLIIFLSAVLSGFGQSLEAGPMLGHITHREATVWMAVDENVSYVELILRKKDEPASQVTYSREVEEQAHNALTFTLPELEMNTVYEYRIALNGEVIDAGVPTEFKTRELWEFRKAPYDFSFLLGSCAYINDSLYDRPGKPYGRSPLIFESMAETKADFNVFHGDYLYFREADFSSRSGMLYRYAQSRSIKEQKKLLAVRPNYSVWDDHDYGPNDANRSFEFKDFSRDLFMSWWANPSYGENGEGIYTRFRYSDCDFFLLDNRWFRDANNYPDSVDGKLNTSKKHFGEQQLEWLKNSILSSNATFKFIIGGGQFINSANKFECFTNYTAEYQQFISFLKNSKIEGVIFLSGDRHHTEMLRDDSILNYPLYEFTCSPLSSGTYKMSDKSGEYNNPIRVKGSLINENNYAKLSITGPDGNRVVTITVHGVDGKELWKQSIAETQLTNKKK